MNKMSSNNTTPIFEDNISDCVVPGSHMRDSEPAFSDQDMSSTRVTPIYWSASQLLSKLGEASPHPSSYQNESYPPGHILSSHIVSPRTGDSMVGPLDYSHHRATIPDEFCVTVSDLHFSDSITSNIYSGSDSSDSQHRRHSAFTSETELRHSHRGKDKVPPPLFPKPKNNTEV